MKYSVKVRTEYRPRFSTKKGSILDRRILEKREKVLGKVFETNSCGKCVVIEYNRKKDVLVKFYEPHCIVKCCITNLERGGVFNPMYPTFYGKGFIGVGEYNSHNKEPFKLWCSMLHRVFSEKALIKHPEYRDVIICKDWLNFQNFAEWFYQQEFSTGKDESGRKYHLDKDVLSKIHKVYSPETCCFIPQEVNALLTLRGGDRGNYAIGVSLHKSTGKFLAKINYYGEQKRLGVYVTQEEAFLVYKKAKESYIKEVAEKWKGRISDQAYESLIKWEISIDD